MLPNTIIIDNCIVSRDQFCTRGSQLAILSIDVALRRSIQDGFHLNIYNIPIVSTGSQIYDSNLLSRLAQRQLRYEDLFQPNQW